MSYRSRAPIWNFFTHLDKSNAKCDLCHLTLSYKSSTSNMKRHMKRRHPRVKLNVLADEKIRITDSDSLNSRCCEDESSVLEQNSTTQGAANSLIHCETLNYVSIPTASVASELLPGTSRSSPIATAAPQHKQKKVRAKQSTLSYLHSQNEIPVDTRKKIDEELILLFTLDFQPFGIVEDEGFRRFVKILNPNYTLPETDTISKSYIPAMYEKCLNKCKEQIEQISYACLTIEYWKSISNESFLAITAHFINVNFEMKSMLLKCCNFTESHKSGSLSTLLEDIVEDWEISSKITFVVSDRAANIEKASEDLGWKHFICFAHSLNLVLRKGLKKCSVTISKMKEIVGHFEESAVSNSKLMAYQKNSGVEQPKKLKQEYATQRNSTLHMIQRFVELEDALRSILDTLDTELPVLTLQEWDILKDLIQVLTPFENIAAACSREKYVMASLVIVFVAALSNVLDELTHSGNLKCNSSIEIINDLKAEVQNCFGNVEYSDTLACCTFLDPRFKIHVFRSANAADKIKKQMISLVLEEMAKQSSESIFRQTTSNQQEAENQPLSIWTSIDKTLAKYQPQEDSDSRAITEIERYIESDIISRDQDPLCWWKHHEYAYPYLSAIAKKKLCALATSVSCERLFSRASQISNERRNYFESNNLQKILFLNVNHNFI